MLGSSSTQSNVSSAPLLQGMPSFIGDLTLQVANYTAAVSQALEDIASEEEQKVQEMAQSHDSGWSSLSSSISVKYDHNARELKYSASSSEESEFNVSELEFGGFNSPAYPLLRVAAAEARDSFRSRVTDRTYDLLRTIPR